MSSRIAELLLPAIRWDARRGYEPERPAVAKALDLGVGGFVLYGGPETEVRALTKELQQTSRVPLLIAAELERGTGQQFSGATGLPPLSALATLNDSHALTRAAKLTAREARTMGVNWALAPICDLDLIPRNPLTGARAVGSDPKIVGPIVGSWIEACQHEGVLACAKHFPGRGRVKDDAPVNPPSVDVPRSALFDTDFIPFRAAIGSRVASVMMAHASYPTLDASELPATTSTQIMRYLLREKLGFQGLIVSDVLIGLDGGCATTEMEAELAIRALDAGCDVLLCPRDLAGVVAALEAAVQDGPLYDDRIEQSVRRRLKWAQWAAPPTEYRKASVPDVMWAGQIAERVVHLTRGSRPALGALVDLVVLNDAPEAPPPAAAMPFMDTLRTGNIVARLVASPTEASSTPIVIALFSEGSGGGAQLGYSDELTQLVSGICATAREAERQVVVAQFGPPLLAEALPEVETVVCAWSGDRCMQEAAARWIVGKR